MSSRGWQRTGDSVEVVMDGGVVSVKQEGYNSTWNEVIPLQAQPAIHKAGVQKLDLTQAPCVCFGGGVGYVCCKWPQ